MLEMMGLVEMIGIIAFVVTAITELLKGLRPIDKMPTKLLAIVIGMISSLLYAATTFAAFSIQAVIFTVSLGFASAFVAIFGWDTLAEIWDRFQMK